MLNTGYKRKRIDILIRVHINYILAFLLNVRSRNRRMRKRMLKWSISLFSMEHQKYILPKYGQPLYFSEERCVGKKNIKTGKNRI